MPDRSADSSERLSLIIETQREIARAGNDLEAVLQLVAERSQAITGADGAMVNLIDGEMLQTRAVSGIAVGAIDARRLRLGQRRQVRDRERPAAADRRRARTTLG